MHRCFGPGCFAILLALSGLACGGGDSSPVDYGSDLGDVGEVPEDVPDDSGADADADADADTGPVDADGDTYPEGEDCDDTNYDVNPGANELCDGIDNNCDGATDEDSATDASTWYSDVDGDDYGDPSSSRTACSEPAGYTDNGDDCNDADPAVNPDATEICNGSDDDCDGETDEDGATGATEWYPDVDGDGYGGTEGMRMACEMPAGFISIGGDCDDANDDVNPDEFELCNTIDDNCNGTVDEGVQTTWYADCDHDGYAPLGAQTYLGCPGISPPVVGPLGCTDPTHLAGAWITTAPTTAINDCGPNEPRAHPGQTQWYAAGYFAGARLTYDFDCDGASTLQYAGYTATATCRVSGLSCNPAGSSWVGSRAPSCGESGSLYRCDHQVSGCVASAPMTVPAACR